MNMHKTTLTSANRPTNQATNRPITGDQSAYNIGCRIIDFASRIASCRIACRYVFPDRSLSVASYEILFGAGLSNSRPGLPNRLPFPPPRSVAFGNVFGEGLGEDLFLLRLWQDVCHPRWRRLTAISLTPGTCGTACHMA